MHLTDYPRELGETSHYINLGENGKLIARWGAELGAEGTWKMSADDLEILITEIKYMDAPVFRVNNTWHFKYVIKEHNRKECYRDTLYQCDKMLITEPPLGHIFKTTPEDIIQTDLEEETHYFIDAKKLDEDPSEEIYRRKISQLRTYMSLPQTDLEPLVRMNLEMRARERRCVIFDPNMFLHSWDFNYIVKMSEGDTTFIRTSISSHYDLKEDKESQYFQTVSPEDIDQRIYEMILGFLSSMESLEMKSIVGKGLG
jgi:hypothetical protein